MIWDELGHGLTNAALHVGFRKADLLYRRMLVVEGISIVQDPTYDIGSHLTAGSLLVPSISGST